MTLASSVHEIKALILSYHPVIVVETVEEERLRSILYSVAGQARMTMFEWSITRGLTKAETPNAMHRTTAQPEDALSHLGNLIVDGVYLMKDLGQHLSDPATVRLFRETAERFTHTKSALILSGASVSIPPELEPLVLRYPLRLPGADELAAVMQNVAMSMGRTPEWNREVNAGQIDQILRALRGLTLHQARQAIAQSIVNDGRLHAGTVDSVLNHKVQLMREGGLLEYYPPGDNEFALGGFANLRKWLDRSAMGFTERARAMNLTPPRGIMIVGVQGCGKSLAAKVIARDWKMPLLKLDMGSLYNKYMGETEKNFRSALSMAESLAPCILWLDEVEKALATSSGGGDDGVSGRLLGHFLTWLQENKNGIFVVATANNIDALPPELMRKGRFDEVFFVDLPDATERKAIFDIHLRLRNQDPEKIGTTSLALASEGFSGAEIEQAVIAALYRSLHLQAALSGTHILSEIEQTVPLSVSRKVAIDQLRMTAQNRFVPV